MLVLSRRDVESLLDPHLLEQAVAAAMRDLSAGRASMPPRVAALVPARRGLLGAMPAFLPSAPALTAKLVTLFPDNRDRPTHQAIICCFEPDTGTPLAVMDGTYVTAARTAAASALATRLLARPGARVVGILGTGVQARAHARALADFGLVRIAGRDPAKARSLADELAAAGIQAEASPSLEDAVRSADVVCATTHSEAPVVRREWLRPGTHVCSVGYNTMGEGEVDSATVRDSLVVVESRAMALAAPPAGVVELRVALEKGAVGRDLVLLELGELVAGQARGRTDDRQLTLYKSVGVAVQDAAAAAAAAAVLEAAASAGVGTEVEV